MKRILVTRPRSQADDFAEKLSSAGFEPIFLPVIEIRPIEDNVALDRALAALECYSWVVFTSVNAVDIVFDVIARSEATKQSPFMGEGMGIRVAAIGPKTSEALQARGVTPDFVPDEYVAESILPGLGDLRDRWVLLPRAEIARKALPRAIAEAGGFPHEISVYKTLPVEPDFEGLAALKAGVDWITFTSPSTVQNFAVIARRHGLDPLNLPGSPKIACIGPITERAASDEDFKWRSLRRNTRQKDWSPRYVMRDLWRKHASP
jgi:uroporphyrinogen III methyltransferase/synthase